MPRTFNIRGYEALEPYAWPQDDLRVPDGQGGMPRVNEDNARRIERDFFVFSTIFRNPVLGASPSVVILPTPADGDFWCEQIRIAYIDPGGTFTDNPAMLFKVRDIRSGNSLTNPSVRTNAFWFDVERLNAQGNGGGGLVQPYCFTRNGGIEITLQNDIYTAGAIDVFVSLIGWKEYQNASR